MVPMLYLIAIALCGGAAVRWIWRGARRPVSEQRRR
jgi:hypothetical protein